MTNRITGFFRDYDPSDFTSPPSLDPMPLDDETHGAAVMRLVTDLNRLGYDAWPKGGGVNIVSKQNGKWVAHRVELLGEHVLVDDDSDDAE